MSTPEKKKLIGIRIPEPKWRLLKQALGANGTTMQTALEKWVDAYIEKFGPK